MVESYLGDFSFHTLNYFITPVRINDILRSHQALLSNDFMVKKFMIRAKGIYDIVADG